MLPRRKKRNVKPIEIPPYFPPSRYETTKEDPVIDYKNRKILSLPSIVATSTKYQTSINHVGRRSVEGEIINETKSLLLGESQTSNESSGIHPGILYGGPAGGILAPIGVWFYKIFKKRRKKKKKRKTKQLEDSDDDDSDEEDNEKENVKRHITTTVTNQITNAGNSVMSHIKGKITDTNSLLIKDLKAQSLAQEDEIMENIKTTVLEQEQAMMVNIKQKISNTQTNLIKDLIHKLPIFGRSKTESVEATKQTSALEENIRDKDTVSKLSDDEIKLMDTVKRRISNDQDALLPEIEKSIETTNKTIIEKIENKIPEARGPSWNRTKSQMKERENSLFNEIKSILTCSENKIIDDVKSQIGEMKLDNGSDQIIEGAWKTGDEVRISIIEPELHKLDKQNEKTTKSGIGSTFPNIIKHKIFSLRFFKHYPEKLNATSQIETEDDKIEKITLENEKNESEMADRRMKNSFGGDEIAVQKLQTESSKVNLITSQITLEGSSLKDSEISDIHEIVDSGEHSNVFRNSKNEVPMPLNLLKHDSKVQIEAMKGVITENVMTDQTEKMTITTENEITADIIPQELNTRKRAELPVTVDETLVINNAADSIKSAKRNDDGIIYSKISNAINIIKHKLPMPSKSLQRDLNAPSGIQMEIKNTTAIEGNILKCEVNECNETSQTMIVNSETGEELMDEVVKPEHKHLTTADEFATHYEVESTSSKDSTLLGKIKHNVSIPLQFLNHKTTQTISEKYDKIEKRNLNSEECDKAKTCTETLQRTAPIPIPLQQTKLDHFSTTQALDTREEHCDNDSESSSGNSNEKDDSFFNKIKSVPYLPFSINFSGIPDKVISFVSTTNHNGKNYEDINADLSEVKIETKNMALSRPLPEENPIQNNQKDIDYTEVKQNESTRHVRFSPDNSENVTRKWIVLDYTDDDWPSHLPRKNKKNESNSIIQEKQNSEKKVTPSMVNWLQLVDEDVCVSWPNHLPKNLHSVSSTKNKTNELKKNERTHARNRKTQLQQDYSESPDEDNQKWSKCSTKNLVSKRSDNENDRKESIVSTTSEFSTTSSIYSTSSGTLESTDSFSGYKLPNIDSKLQKKKRNNRFKSLDSGIHHYYGEYIAIEYPIADSGYGEQMNTSSDNSKTKDVSESFVKTANRMTLEFKYQEDGEINQKDDETKSLLKSEEGSSENSQEDVKSVISATEIINTEATAESARCDESPSV